MNLCIISSCGGHLTEIRCLRSVYDRYNVTYILNDKAILPKDMETNTYFVTHSERDVKTLKNFYEFFRLFKVLKPKVILTTGAGPAIPAGIVARLLNIKVIYVETITRITKPSLTGYLMRYIATHLFYQWRELSKFFPKGTYIGPLI